MLAATLLATPASANVPVTKPQGNQEKSAERFKYKIDLKIDFDRLAYHGVERVRWINNNDKPTSTIYFHLYPNMRVADQQVSPVTGNSSTSEIDEPRMEIIEVRSVATDSSLPFVLEEQGTVLRVKQV
jgi:hypothetical protein